MKTLSLLSFTLLLCTACQSNSINLKPTTPLQQKESKVNPIMIPQNASQLLMVTTKEWNTKEGTLQRYEKNKGIWEKIGQPISIILGRNGLGWGIGLHTTPQNASYIKKEGDGRAPAGLFHLGHGFGYNPYDISFPYHISTTSDQCVDDSRSQWYNQIVDSTQVQRDYKSFEKMKLNNPLYKYGITVEHNPQAMAYGGSCIFIHIRSENGKGTAGCTAMRESEMMTLLRWLKKEKQPLLLQLPKEEMLKVNLLL